MLTVDEVKSLLMAKHGRKIARIRTSATLTGRSWRIETKPLFVRVRRQNQWIGRFQMRYVSGRNPRVEFERLSGSFGHVDTYWGTELTPYIRATRHTKSGNPVATDICFGTGSYLVADAKRRGDAFTVLDAMLTIIDQPTGGRHVYTHWQTIKNRIDDSIDEEDMCKHCSAPKEECVCKTCVGGKHKKEHLYINGCELCKSCRRHCACKRATAKPKVNRAIAEQFAI